MLGIAARVQEIRTRATTLARLQLELVTLELKRKGKALAIAAVLAIIALVVVLYAIGFIFAAIAAGIAETLPLWASLLIVSGLLLLTAAVLLYLAMRSARKAAPTRPVEAVEEAQKTVQEIRDA